MRSHLLISSKTPRPALTPTSLSCPVLFPRGSCREWDHAPTEVCSPKDVANPCCVFIGADGQKRALVPLWGVDHSTGAAIEVRGRLNVLGASVAWRDAPLPVAPRVLTSSPRSLCGRASCTSTGCSEHSKWACSRATPRTTSSTVRAQREMHHTSVTRVYTALCSACLLGAHCHCSTQP